MRSSRLTLLLVVSAALSSAVACSGKGTDAASVATAGARAAMGGAAGTAGGTLNLGGSASSGDSTGASGDCAATFVEAQGQQLAMLIMLDRSLSMDEVVDQTTLMTRWEAVTGALGTFVTNPGAAAVPVGLQYFGLPAPAVPPGGVRMNSSCTISDYATAEVPIAPLSTNAAAITASMRVHGPLTDTPTLPAIKGGIQFVASYAADHPEYKVVLVLATDGVPSGCSSDVMSVGTAAAAGLTGAPSVETYVIGVGSNLAALDAVAMAGGTKQAFLVSDANVQNDLLSALTTIQNAVLPCQYAVPLPTTGRSLDFGKVNVQFTAGGGALQELRKVASLADCTASSNLWYYDDNVAPKEILFCPDTCRAVSGDAAASVNIVLDCKPTVVQ